MWDQIDDFMFAYQNLVHSIGINGLLGLSMWFVLAAGQLSLGQAAFMGIGAYAGAAMTVKVGAPFWLALPVAMVVPAGFALAVGGPTLRLTGVYLAIATLAMGEVLRVALVNIDYLGGALGFSGIPERTETWMIFGLLLVALVGTWRLAKSRHGRALEAIRSDETAAAVMGIPLAGYKMFALVVSAALAGLAGALNAHSATVISPNEYGFEAAVSILSFALLGGIGTPLGPVLGAGVLTVLPELLRSLHELRGIFNGLIIVLVILFLPRGFLPLRLKRAP